MRGVACIDHHLRLRKRVRRTATRRRKTMTTTMRSRRRSKRSLWTRLRQRGKINFRVAPVRGGRRERVAAHHACVGRRRRADVLVVDSLRAPRPHQHHAPPTLLLPGHPRSGLLGPLRPLLLVGGSRRRLTTILMMLIYGHTAGGPDTGGNRV